MTRKLIVFFMVLVLTGFAWPSPAEAGADGRSKEEIRSDGAKPLPYNKLGLAIEIPALDDLNWFLAYYRKDPKPEEIPAYIKSLAERGYFEAKPLAVAELTHFLAAALEGQEAVLGEMEKTIATASSKERRALEKVILKARAFESPQADSAENIRLLWAEFRAVGREDSLRKIIGLVGLPAISENKELINEAVRSLLFGIPAWGDDGIMKREREKATGPLKERLEKLEEIERKIFRYSDDFFDKGKNYRQLKQYDEALKAFEQCISAYPYYPSAYCRMGLVYEDLGNKEKAFHYVMLASRMDPASESIQYSMGRQYSIRSKWVESIPYFEKAVEGRPESAVNLYCLGRSYWNAGEKDKAVPYLMRFLEKDPNGENSGWARKCLNSVNVAVDRPPPDRHSLLRAGAWDLLEQDFKKLLSSREKNENGRSRLGIHYNDFCEKPSSVKTTEEWVNLLRDWAEKSRSPHFAWACLGYVLIEYAWEARGRGWGSSVVPDGKELFKERLIEAGQALERAWKLDPSDPIPPSDLITVATGLGLGRDEMEKQFKRALSADRTALEPYAAKLNYLMPKWHGSRVEMFDFARKTAAEAPRGTLLPTVLAKAHWEMYHRGKDEGKNHFDSPEAWREIKEVYERVLADFPDALATRNFLAKAAFHARDYQTARAQLEIIGDDWDKGVWGNSNYFLNSKKEVFEMSQATSK